MSGEPSLREQIRGALSEVARLRAAGASPADVSGYIYPQLAKIRDRIRRMPLLPRFETDLKAALTQSFGPDGTYGVFVRSDTNAEDLPQFSGAGLNLTVPNVVGYDKIVEAIKNVWASPFEERAFDWRARILENQEDVYPSILMLRTVRSAKSGVLVTVNLEDGSTDDITVNVNEGVSAVVDGGTAESLLLEPDGGVRLLQQARSPYRKVVDERGGFRFVPPVGDDRVLTDGDIVQLRAMVQTINERYPKAKRPDGTPLPWDIEFGFEGGELRLFQIRPLVRSVTPSAVSSAAKVDLTEVPGA